MRDGSWPDKAVRATVARALVDGVEREIESVSLTSEMAGGFALIDGTGDPVTDGSVSWAQQSDVAVSVPQPFARFDSTWPPTTGAGLTVEVGDNEGQWWKQVTGLVDSTTGSLSGPQATSRVVDYVDKLSTQVWHDPILHHMPPGTSGQAFRRVGLAGSYVTDLAARAAGFYATPPPSSGCLLSVPCMGSMWPEIGNCRYANLWENTTIGVSEWVPTDYGCAALKPDATYEFNSFPAITATLNLIAQPVGGSMSYFLWHDLDDHRGFAVRYTTADRIEVRLNPEAGGAEIVSLPRDGAKRASIRVATVQATQTINVTMLMDDGRQVDGSLTHPDFADEVRFSAARVAGSGVAGAFLIETYVAGSSTIDEPVTAIMRFAPAQRLSATRQLKGETAISLLSDQAKAQGSSFWIDSEGRLRWVDRGILEADPVKVVKTTDLTVDNFAWADNLESVRKQVVLKRRQAAISRSIEDNVLLWQGSAQELVSNQVVEEWLEPAENFDWVLPDLNFDRVLFDVVNPLLPFGSWIGASLVDNNPESPDQLTASTVYGFGAEAIEGTIKITHSVLGAITLGRTLVTQVSNDVVNLPRNWRGMNLPLLRGRGRVQWADKSTTHNINGPGIGSYEHDAGWFVQDTQRTNELRDWLIARVTTPTPTVTSVDIDPDPRLELGDKITIRDTARTGIEFDLVLTRITQAWGGDRPTMSLAGRVTRVAQVASVTDPASPWGTFLTDWSS